MSKKLGIIKITRATYVSKFKLELIFSDGQRRLIDFSPFLKANSRLPEVNKYAKESAFKKFKLVDGDLIWGDFEMLFPIIDLYEGEILHHPATHLNEAS